MALAQFGGRGGGSSGGGSAREIGEMVLVPSTFENDSYVEGGTVVTAASHPSLFERLVEASTPTSFSLGGIVNTVSSAYADDPVTIPVGTVLIGSELLQIHSNGIVSSMDSSTVSTFRGTMPAKINGLSVSNFLRGTVNVVYNASRILVHATPIMTNGSGIFLYSDDLGATWTSAPGFVYSAYRTFVATSSYFFMYDVNTLTAQRSSDGITWNSIVNPAATVATSLTTVSVYANPTTSNITYVSGNDTKVYFSNDHGASWTDTPAVAGTLATISNIAAFSDGLFYTGTSGVIMKAVKSTDGGQTWTQISSGTPNLAGTPYPMYLGVQNGRLMLSGGGSTTGALGTTTTRTVYTSPTGVTWTEGALAAGVGPTATKCAYAFDKAIGYLTNSKPIVFGNVTPFTATAVTTTYSCFKSTANLFNYAISTPTRLFAFSTTTPTSSYSYTDDGVTWNSGTLPSSVTIASGYYDSVSDTIFLVHGGTSCFISHDRGQTWLTQPLGGIAGVRVFKGNNSPVITGATGGTRLTVFGDTPGTDNLFPIGGSFATLTWPAFTNPYNVVGYHQGLVGNTTTANRIIIWQNVDDVTYSTIDLTFTPLVFGVVGDTVIAVGSSKWAYCVSPDKVALTASWTEGTLPASSSWNVVLPIDANRIMVMATGSRNVIIGDGTYWTLVELDLPSGDIGSAAYFMSKVFVLSSSTNEFFSSTTATSKVVPAITTTVPGTKYVIKAS